MVFAVIGCSTAHAAELELPAKINQEGLSRITGEPESPIDFFKNRTQFGLGFDEEYNDNLLLEDNKKRDDWISTLKGLVIFADPRGSIQYGLQEEVRAYRYHYSNNNAVDHDSRFFFDFDPGGRTQWRTEYLLKTQHALVFGAETTDILRRSTEFQESLETAWKSRLRYALNNTNYFVPQITYTTLDDKTTSDANIDRSTFELNADLDHNLTPTWTVFAGYALKNISVPKTKLKNSQSNGGRLGVRHPLSKTEELELIFTGQQTQFEDGVDTVDLSFSGKLAHELGPRTKLELTYDDSQGTSFAAQTRRFRGRGFASTLTYELTPLISLSGGAGSSVQTSGSADAVAGSPGQGSSKNKGFSFSAGLVWNIFEKTSVTINYSYSRSPTRDYTNNRVTFSAKTVF